jgi:hypothetical protein
MRKIFFIAFFVSSLVFGADVEDGIRVVEQNGVSYVCFDVIASQIVLDMRLKYPLLDQENLLLKDQVKVKEEQIIRWQSGAENLMAQLTIFADLNADLQKRIDSSNAWYRSNILWAVVGVAVGFGVAVGVVKAINP